VSGVSNIGRTDMSDPLRLSVSLRPTDAGRLEELTESTGMTKNEVIRHALATHVFIQRTLQSGGTFIVEDANGNKRHVEFVS
jgi:hypothetical protein